LVSFPLFLAFGRTEFTEHKNMKFALLLLVARFAWGQRADTRNINWSALPKRPSAAGGMMGIENIPAPDMTEGIKKLYVLLQCDVCLQVMESLSKDVKYLVEAEKTWSPEVLRQRVKISCEDPEHLPGEMLHATCEEFIEKHGTHISKEVKSHWSPQSEDYEEAIDARKFCNARGVCTEGQDTVKESIKKSEIDRTAAKEKLERELQERDRKKKEKKERELAKKMNDQEL